MDFTRRSAGCGIDLGSCDFACGPDELWAGPKDGDDPAVSVEFNHGLDVAGPDQWGPSAGVDEGNKGEQQQRHCDDDHEGPAPSDYHPEHDGERRQPEDDQRGKVVDTPCASGRRPAFLARLGRDRKVAGHLLDRDGTNNDQRENSKEQQPPLGADLILDGERLPIGGRFAGPGADMWKRRLGEVTNRKLNLISRHVIQG